MNKIIVSQYYYNSSSLILKQHYWGFVLLLVLCSCQMSEVFFLHRSHPHPITQIPRRGRVGPETCEICTSKAACQWWALFCEFWWCLCFLQVRAAPPPPKQLAQGQVQKREEVEITLVWLTLCSTFYKLTLPCLDALSEFGLGHSEPLEDRDAQADEYLSDSRPPP